ncbi:MAG: TRAP transporter large permease subunit [Alphaproteobacteria bacterium]
MVQALGLIFVIVGLAQATGLSEILPSADGLLLSLFRPFMITLALLLAVFSADARPVVPRRLATVDLVAAALALISGLWTAWCLSVHSPSMAAALVGLAALSMAAWRSWGTTLAALMLAAVLHGAILQHGSAGPETPLIDTLPALAGQLWFDPDDGVLGWLPDILLSTVFPVFILGSLLAARISPAASDEAAADKLRPGHGGIDASRMMIATMVMGLLIMTERPGTDAPILGKAMLLPALAWLAWIGLASPGGSAPGRPGPRTPPDIALVLTVTAVGLFALVSGASLAQSAMLALALTIAVSAFDSRVRRQPMVLARALAQSGVAFAKLLVAAATAAVIIAVLDRTGLPLDAARLLAGAAGEAPFPLLVLTALAVIGLGMVMPWVAVYPIVVTMIGPSLRTVGLAELTIHLFVLVASAGASVIAHGMGAKAMAGARHGIALIGIALALAANPELLLVPGALADVGRPDRGGDMLTLGFAVLRLGCMVYLLHAAARGFAGKAPRLSGVILPGAAALACVAADPWIYGTGLLLCALIAAGSWRSVRSAAIVT